MLDAKIRSLCAKDGITLAELERKTGLGNGVIARWNSSNPRLNSLMKVADYFGVTMDELLRDAEQDSA